jgi:uncharacterized protein YbjT (DUF2867 family)
VTAMNDRVLVIGGTRGAGFLISRLLLERGYRVRVLARDPAEAAPRLGPAIELIPGDITKAASLPPAVEGAAHLIFTAGVHSGRIARESLVRLTDYEGVLNTLAAARNVGFDGRFLYLNSIGVTTPSLTAGILNLLKRNALVWRRRVEDEIRSSGLDYTIIRVGFLLDRPGGQRKIVVSQEALPLAPRHRIARTDVAETFIEALQHPRTSHATFDIVWGKGNRSESWNTLFERLKPDT